MEAAFTFRDEGDSDDDEKEEIMVDDVRAEDFTRRVKASSDDDRTTDSANTDDDPVTPDPDADRRVVGGDPFLGRPPSASASASPGVEETSSVVPQTTDSTVPRHATAQDCQAEEEKEEEVASGDDSHIPASSSPTPPEPGRLGNENDATRDTSQGATTDVNNLSHTVTLSRRQSLFKLPVPPPPIHAAALDATQASSSLNLNTHTHAASNHSPGQNPHKLPDVNSTGSLPRETVAVSVSPPPLRQYWKPSSRMWFPVSLPVVTPGLNATFSAQAVSDSTAASTSGEDENQAPRNQPQAATTLSPPEMEVLLKGNLEQELRRTERLRKSVNVALRHVTIKNQKPSTTSAHLLSVYRQQGSRPASKQQLSSTSSRVRAKTPAAMKRDSLWITLGRSVQPRSEGRGASQSPSLGTLRAASAIDDDSSPEFDALFDGDASKSDDALEELIEAEAQQLEQLIRNADSNAKEPLFMSRWETAINARDFGHQLRLIRRDILMARYIAKQQLRQRNRTASVDKPPAAEAQLSTFMTIAQARLFRLQSSLNDAETLLSEILEVEHESQKLSEAEAQEARWELFLTAVAGGDLSDGLSHLRVLSNLSPGQRYRTLRARVELMIDSTLSSSKVPEHAHGLEQLIQDALTFCDTDPEALCALARLQMRLGSHKEAEHSLVRALHVAPHHLDTLELYSLLLSSQGRHSQCKRLLVTRLALLMNSANNADPAVAAAHYRMALTLIDEGDHSAALCHLSQSIHLQPQAVWPRLVRATLHMVRKPMRAVDDLSIAMTCDVFGKHRIRLLLLRARSYRNAGKLSFATADLHAAVKLAHKDAGSIDSNAEHSPNASSTMLMQALAELGALYASQGKHGRAADYFLQAHRTCPAVAAPLQLLVSAILRRVEIDQSDQAANERALCAAQKHACRLVRLAPTHDSHWTLLARVQRCRNQLSAASSSVVASQIQRQSTQPLDHVVDASIAARIEQPDQAVRLALAPILSTSMDRCRSLSHILEGDLSASLARFEADPSLLTSKAVERLRFASQICLRCHQPEAALQCISVVIQAEAQPEDMLILGLCCRLFGDHHLAIEAFSRMLDVDVRNWRALLQRSFCLFKLGDVKLAIADLRACIDAAPTQKSARPMLALATLLASQPSTREQALSICQELLTRYPGYVTAKVVQACLLATKGDKAEAELLLKAAADVPGPDNVLAIYNWAVFLHKQGNMSKADQLYVRALQASTSASPIRDELLLNRALVLTDLKRHKEARACLVSSGLDERCEGALAFAVGRALSYCGDAERAQFVLERQLEDNAQSIPILMELGRIHVLQEGARHRRDAMSAYSRVLRLQPGHETAALCLANILQADGNLQGALHVVTQAVNAQQRPSASVLEHRAVLNLQLLQFQLAHHDIETAVTRSYSASASVAARIHSTRGVVRLFAGDERGALISFQKAHRLSDSDSTAHYNVGNAYLGQKQLAQAVNHYDTAIKHDHNAWQAHANRGYSWFLRGNHRRALDDFEAACRIFIKRQCHTNPGLLSDWQQLTVNTCLTATLCGRWDRALGVLERFLAPNEAHDAAANATVAATGEEASAVCSLMVKALHALVSARHGASRREVGNVTAM